MSTHVIDKIIYPVQTKRGLKFPKGSKRGLNSDLGGAHIPTSIMEGSQQLKK